MEETDMTYNEVQAMARGKMGHCYSCPVCDGIACKNTIPGPGSKGTGTVFHRNAEAWQKVLLNLDTLGRPGPRDTSFSLFGERFELPVFAAPIAAVASHYSDLYDEESYDCTLARGCRSAGIAAFTGDGLDDSIFGAGCKALSESGFSIPTIKPWHRDLVLRKIDLAREHGAKMIAMDIDASGLPFLKKMTPPSGPKTVEELREFIDYAQMPFIVKGIMTVRGAQKALEAGASAIVVSNHGGRVLDHTPATASVLPEIAKFVDGRMTVLVDGGIRSGSDVFKALGLGADAVLIGRPFVNMVYGAAEEGIRVYTEKLKTELCDCMEMCGCTTLKDITNDVIFHG